MNEKETIEVYLRIDITTIGAGKTHAYDKKMHVELPVEPTDLMERLSSASDFVQWYENNIIPKDNKLNITNDVYISKMSQGALGFEYIRVKRNDILKFSTEVYVADLSAFADPNNQGRVGRLLEHYLRKLNNDAIRKQSQATV